MQAFDNVDMTEMFPQNFLTLTVSYNSLDADEVRAKYLPEIVERLISGNKELSLIISDNNNRFAIRIDHHYYMTRNENIATAKVKIDAV